MRKAPLRLRESPILRAFVVLAASTVIVVTAPAQIASAYTTYQFANAVVVPQYSGVYSVSGNHVGGKAAVSGTHAALWARGSTVDATRGVILYGASGARGGPVTWNHPAQAATKIRVSWIWAGGGTTSPLAVYGWRHVN